MLWYQISTKQEVIYSKYDNDLVFMYKQVQFIDALHQIFLWVEIFLFYMCYHVVLKMHSQLDYELNDL